MFLLSEIKHLTAFGDNTYLDVFIAIAVFLGLLILLKIFQIIILARLRKIALRTKTDFDDVLIKIFQQIKPPFYVLISLWTAVQFLTLPKLAAQIIKVIFLITLIYEVIQAIDKIVRYF